MPLLRFDMVLGPSPAAAARWGGAREKRGLARGTKAVKIAQWAKVLATKSDDLSLIHPGPAWWRELFDS